MHRRLEQLIGIFVLILCISIPMFVGYKINEIQHRKKEANVIAAFLNSNDNVEIGQNINETTNEEIDLGGDGISEVGYGDATIMVETENYVNTTKETPQIEETKTIEPDVTQVEEVAQEIDTKGVGHIEGDILYLDSKFTITYYCPCEKCCGKGGGKLTKSGTTPTAGRTIAVCKDQIPLGATVIIDGHEYVAEDVGGSIKWNKIDIFVNDHQEALNLGKQRNIIVGIKK